jgi:hypothetical protein
VRGPLTSLTDTTSRSSPVIPRGRDLASARARNAGEASAVGRGQRNPQQVSSQATLELALCFHHAALGTHDKVAGLISRLRELTHSGDYAFYAALAYLTAIRATEPAKGAAETTSKTSSPSASRRSAG